MTSGDLRTSAAVRKRPKCFLERQLDLLGVPPARQPLGDRLTTADLDSKTFETQGPRAIHVRIVAFVAESITRVTSAAAGAQHRVGTPLTRFRPSAPSPPRPVQRKLLILTDLLSRSCHRLSPMCASAATRMPAAFDLDEVY
jgi:hypothetical protein